MNICDNIPLYLYDEMNEQNKRDYEKHLQICQECRDSVRIFAEVKDSMMLTSAPLQTINTIFEKTTRKKTFPFANIAKTLKITTALAAGLIIGVCAFSLKEFSAKSAGIFYYADYSLEEIETIDDYLDEMEDYFLV